MRERPLPPPRPRPERSRSGAERPRPERPGPETEGARPAAERIPEAERASDPGKPSQPSDTEALADHLRALALPHLEAVSSRLSIARHRTLVDDRLESESATLRFRLMPWQAPFDEPVTVGGSVLELAVDGNEVVARFWLDPLAEEPTEERRVGRDRLSPSWLEEISLTFVARTLRRG